MLHARQLIAARALAGWSQEDLAAAAGVSLSTVRGLEGGSRDTRFSSVVAIIEALRRRGVELAQSSERFMGGVLVVRGSPSDWLCPMPSEEGGDPSRPVAHGDNGVLLGGTGPEPSGGDAAGRDAPANPAGCVEAPAPRRGRKADP